MAAPLAAFFHSHSHAGHEHLPWVVDVALHALLDSAKMLPFLFLAYLVIEYLERRKGDAMERLLAKGGRFGFVPGALLGVVPQCGFSAMAANFYGSRVITLGTLLAVFIATSDEAIPVMLAQPGSWPAMAALVGVKLVWALLVGFLVDVALKKVIPASLRGGYGGSAEEVDCHHHDEEDGILWAAAKHTVSIFLTVLVFTFLFGLLVEWLGEARISGLLAGLGPAQPVVAALFGLIPNCASSVLLTQLYLSGSISFGSVVAGLSANAGIGLTVLFRANRNLRQNLFILGLLFVLGVVPGLVLHLLGV
ncbi:MAG: putative manganese transporter [Oscillospiraceae bacterium]